MMKESIEGLYTEFLSKYRIVLLFISENFGTKGILASKNCGLIPHRQFDIKNSQIKGYVFHGYGCEFMFKRGTIDVEFCNDSIGFTEWSFYCFTIENKLTTTQTGIKIFLEEKVERQELKFNGVIYELNK